MKCPKCQTVSTKKERVGGACPKCGWVFRFDPPAPLSDFEVEHALQAVSQGGALRFTRAQLVAEVERVLVRRTRRLYEAEAVAVVEGASSPLVFFLALGLAAAGLLLLLVFEERCGAPLIILAVFLVISRLVRRAPEEVAKELRSKADDYDPRAQAIVDRYVQGVDTPLLLPPVPEAAVPPPGPRAAAREFDLESYGFDRVVVVQGNENVDMLVKNQFHFQHNAAIVSFTGYPQHVATLVRKQLEAGTASAKVFLLHDGDVAGYQLVDDWKRTPWGQLGAIHHVGLGRVHAERLLPRRPAQSLAAEPVPAADRAYFQTSRVSLSALRPQQMMTLLFNAMSAADKGASEAASESFVTPLDTMYDFG